MHAHSTAGERSSFASLANFRVLKHLASGGHFGVHVSLSACHLKCTAQIHAAQYSAFSTLLFFARNPFIQTASATRVAAGYTVVKHLRSLIDYLRRYKK
jgi:hypothetical protein